MTLNIGVLAIQGDVTENFLSVMASLSELGVDGAVSQVKTAEQISKLDGLITVSYTHLTLPTICSV